MCQTLKTISTNKSGKLTFCKSCNCFKLSFSNLAFEFTDKQLKKFGNYLKSIPVNHWLGCNESSGTKRQIPLHTGQQNLTLMFNQREFCELKELVGLKSNSKEWLTIMDIDAPMVMN